MFNKNRCPSSALIGALAGMTLTRLCFAQNTPSVTVSYALDTAQPTVNVPVFLKITIHNNLAEPIVVNMAVNDHGYGGFHAQITRPTGETAEAPQIMPDEVVSGTAVSVDPSETASTVVLVNKWFDFDLPGEYILEVEFARPIMTAGGTRISNPDAGRISIDVGPRDPVVLDQICANLEEQIASASVASSYELAEILAHVRDPAAVPFLARLLQANDKMAPVLAGGLERIADASAVDTLLRYVSDVSEDRRESARASLARIMTKTRDPDLQRKIADSLR